MKVTQESTGDLTARIILDFTEEDYAPQVTKKLKEMARKANIPGFRQGKVPVGVIRKMYGQGVLAEEVNQLISDSLYKYIAENKLPVLGNPIPADDHEPVDFDEQKDFQMRFDIGVMPELNLDFLDEMEPKHYTIVPDEKMMEGYVEDVRNQFEEKVDVDAYEEGCTIEGEFVELDAEGNEAEGGIRTNGAVALKDITVEDQKKAFEGLTKDASIDFVPAEITEDAHKAVHFVFAQHGQEDKMDYKFRFTCRNIVKHTPAELNEELFEKAFPGEEIKTEEAFMERLKEEATKGFVPQADNVFLNETMETIMEKADVNLPEDFLKRWVKTAEQDDKKAQVDENWEDYLKTFRWQVVMAKLESKFEDLRITDEDMIEEVKKFFIAQYFRGMPEEQVRAQDAMLTQMAQNMLKNEKEAEQIRSQVMNNKLTEVFKRELKIQEEEMRFDDFVAMMSPKQESNDGPEDAEIIEEVKDETEEN